MRRTASTLWRRRVLAIAGLLLCGAVVYLAYAKRLPFTQGHRIQAVVASSNQLRPGDPVRVAGVEIGEVAEMRPGPGDDATLVLELGDRGRPVKRDATVRIRPRLFLEGGFFVELEPGSPSAPEMPEGGTIPLERTALPVQFGQVLASLTLDVRRAFVDLLGETATGFDEGGARGLGLAARPAGDVLRDGAVVARAARGARRGDLEGFVRDAGRIAAALGSRDEELGRLVSGLRTTTDALARRDAELAATLRETDRTLAAAPAALRDLEVVLPPARRFAAGLRPSLRRLPGVLDDANAGLGELLGALGPGELPRVVSLLGPTVRRLPALLPELRTLLALLEPVTDCTRERLLPVLNAEVPDGPLSSGQPVWQELVHSLTSFGGNVQNFDGNGHLARVISGFGEETLQLGSLPGLQPLTGSVSGGVIGSRPTPLPPGTRSPYRPDLPCREQAPVDLRARTDGPVVPVTRRRGPALAPVRDVPALLQQALEAAR
jgi:phospholipid/cholesterol/gamma-HCH transport system substrate-binding protein